MEPDIKQNLSDLSKIPQKEFEKHFSDWMERDDVARSLQAKLRTDLILNFNKTHLGKQILSQTTTNTGAYGAPTQRLTLSPLVLALNTLVAEFLYAQNCHFSLSVFCTEIPFRNTLPDFESMRCFRFTEPEVLDIYEAVFAGAKLKQDFKKTLSKEYKENPSSSLLLLMLKNLMKQQEEQPQTTDTKEADAQLPTKDATQKTLSDDERQARLDAKTDIYNTNLRYLNKYLIVLSKKVKEMAQQFEILQRRHTAQEPATTMPRPRLPKSKSKRKYENLNRSLERITENLKQMSMSKRKSKRLTAIVSAIDAMSKQFEKCASNFEHVSKDLLSKTAEQMRTELSQGMQSSSKETKASGMLEKQTATEMPEKTYADWVHEMRTSKNGEKFLNRIEISLGKALKKQKQQLINESELKMKHQKALLKLHYKQKLLQNLNRTASRESTVEMRNDKHHESMERQLKLFELKHHELLSSIRDAEQNAVQNDVRATAHASETSTDIKEESKLIAHGVRHMTSDSSVMEEPMRPNHEQKNQTQRSSTFNDVINTQKKLQEMVKTLAEEERNVDHIVYDAKMRIRELESESNLLEQSFRNYLERQRIQKEASRDAAETTWNNYALEKRKIEQKYQLVKQNIRKHHKYRQRRIRSLQNSDDDDNVEIEDESEGRYKRLLNELNVERVQKRPAELRDSKLEKDEAEKSNDSSRSMAFKNAIMEAKAKLFDNEAKLKSLKNFQRASSPFGKHIDYGSIEEKNMRVLWQSQQCLTQQQLPQQQITQQQLTKALQQVYETAPEPAEVVEAPETLLNSTLSELNLQDHTMEHEFEWSTSSSSSCGSLIVEAKADLKPKDVLKLRRQMEEIEVQQQQQKQQMHQLNTSLQTASTSTGINKSRKTLQFHDATQSTKNATKSSVHQKAQENKENLQQHQQQLQQQKLTAATTAQATCQQEGEPDVATLNTKVAATSLVLQQSMAKMNKLFGEEHRALATATATTTKLQNKKSVHTTTPRMRQQQQQKQSNAPAIQQQQHDGRSVAAATTTTTTTQPLALAANPYKMKNKNLHQIEKNNSTKTVIESMATLKRTAATTTAAATTSKQTPTTTSKSKHNNDNCNEAQAFSVDNERSASRKVQQQQKQQQQSQPHQHLSQQPSASDVGSWGVTDSGSSTSNTNNNNNMFSDSKQNVQYVEYIEQEEWELPQAAEVEVGEIIDALNTAVGHADSVTIAFNADNAAAAFISARSNNSRSGSGSSSSSSFDMQLSTAGGGGGGVGAEKSSGSDFWE